MVAFLELPEYNVILAQPNLIIGTEIGLTTLSL